MTISGKTFDETRKKLLTVLQRGEKKLAMPKSGELWKVKTKHGYMFWSESRPMESHTRILMTKDLGVDIVMSLEAINDDSDYLLGLHTKRWKVQVIVGDQIGYAEFTTLNEWYEFFERFSL